MVRTSLLPPYIEYNRRIKMAVFVLVNQSVIMKSVEHTSYRCCGEYFKDLWV